MLSQLLSLLSIGIGLGSVYAVGAVGLSLIFRMTGILHFAHGAVFVVASYTLLAASDHRGMPIAADVVLALAVSVVAGVLVYEGVYRPLEHRGVSELGFVISSFGVLIVSQNAMTLGFGSTARPVAFPHWLAIKSFHAGGVSVRCADIVGLLVALVTIGALAWFRASTRPGLLLRALERNKRLAADLGISYRRYASGVFALGSLLAGVAALLSSFTVPVAPDGGLQWTVSVYIAMAVGGTGSIWSAGVGGLVLGILSTVPDLWIPGSWNIALAFGILVLILLVKPNGVIAGRDKEFDRASPITILVRFFSGHRGIEGGTAIVHADRDGVT